MHPRRLNRRVFAVRDTPAARAEAARWLRAIGLAGRVAWFGARVPQGVPGVHPAQAAHWLGKELDAVVFEASPVPAGDALAVSAGLVRGGGVFLLLADEPSQSPFGRRWRAFLGQEELVWLEPGAPWPEPYPINKSPVAALTRRQREILARIEPMARSCQPGCFLVMAPRGRGKSTLLGELVASWLEAGVQGVRVTAPRRAAVEPLLGQVEARTDSLSCARAGATRLFAAPDTLLAQSEAPPEILVVDEAAAFPVHKLVALAGLTPRLVISTTTSGFEGSGQGFRLRFRATLRRMGVNFREICLERPLRWAPGDFLERWIDRLFLLDANVDATVHGESARSLLRGSRVRWCSGEGLGDREPDLRSVVALLSDAHYRTRPSDLQRLMDDPGVRVGRMYSPEGSLVGVVLALIEPGLDAPTSRSVWSGNRRPSGHFLPSVLAAHGALGGSMRGAFRILRIAVDPRWQRLGLGTRLLRAAEREADRLALGFIGASFGADAELLSFWSAAGFLPLRAGFRRESTSGLHAAVVVRALEPTLKTEFDRLRRSIAADWPLWRKGPLRGLEAATADRFAGMLPPPRLPAPAEDDEQVRAFAFQQRPYEIALPALHRWLGARPGCLDNLAPGRRVLVDSACLQLADWTTLCGLAKLSGRRAVIVELRVAFACLLASLRRQS